MKRVGINMNYNGALGIVLAGGTGSRLHPCTLSVNKQLLPIYDKPLIFYPISVLLLNDIRRIVIICNSLNLEQYKSVLGDGSDFGCQFIYRVQQRPEGLPQAFTICEDLIDDAGVYLILGDNIFHGSDMVHKVKIESHLSATIFTKNVRNPEAFGVVVRNEIGEVIDLVEKPNSFISKEAVLGLYYFPSNVSSYAKCLKKSARGEYEITDLIKTYLQQGNLTSNKLGRGTAWFDTGTFDSLLSAANYVRTLQVEQDSQIANLEEIAFRKGWVEKQILLDKCKKMGKSRYFTLLREILD